MSSNGLIKDGRKHVSCAHSLAQHPDSYKVTLIERNGVTGGQATSISLDKGKYGTSWLNDGVQGGSPAFKHTLHLFKKYGHEAQEVKLQVSFGKGKDGFWTNCFPSTLVERFSGDIKKFGRVLKIIKWTLPVLGLIPIRIMLRMFFFSKEFGDKMVYPLIALFLGTGNQTANVSCAILERLFDDPNMKLWDYDPDTLLPNLPRMVTFPQLDKFYGDWAADLRSKGVDIRLNTEVSTIVSRGKDGIVLQTQASEANPGSTRALRTETYDDLVMAVLADDALRLLGKTATWRERFVLGGARFYDDVTITHSDSEYFNKIYETEFKEELCAEPTSAAQEAQIRFSTNRERGPDGEPGGYRPMYYTHTYASDPKKIEMSFDCTNYQHQFRGGGEKEHVYQTIFLDKTSSALWTQDEIRPDKIILEKWWHQLGHRWQHYVRVVPGMMFVNGRSHKRTLFAGSWTVVNMHELACVSGMVAAYRLGADYERLEEEGDDEGEGEGGGFAEDFFKKVLLLSHASRYTGPSQLKRRKAMGLERK
ncbi:MAG: hypothetical protein M1838_003993 [Thelocarpon superellum]|nr:MAG: hypothetical protein M1838_003993 [Thelocarpon superellum]